MAVNIYEMVTDNGKVEFLPPFKYIPQDTDKTEIWKENFSRMDLLSYKWYDNPDYGKLILLANSGIPSLEFEIEDGTEIIIPYPLQQALNQYYAFYNRFIELYTFE
jgi:hypothetical protein